MIRSFPLLLVFSLFSGWMQAQTAAKQAYQVARTVYNAPIERGHGEEAERFLIGMLPAAGTASGSFSLFGLIPALSLLEEGKTEGMKTLQTAKVNLNVQVKNLVSTEILGSFDLVVTGSGKTRSEAIQRAVQQLRNKKSMAVKELLKMDQLIDQYYEDNCARIKAVASDQVEKRNYAAAVAHLHAVPVETGCYTSTAALRQQAFELEQARLCGNIVQQAEAAAAANRFVEALQLLSKVDAAAPCAPQVKATIQGMEARLDAERKEQWNWLFQMWATGAEVEKARWNALTAISLNWLKSNNALDLIGR
ncbi:MAG: hypothetical protein ACK5SQ_01130 [Chitinophagales bacterium]|jgi:hypothetical protein